MNKPKEKLSQGVKPVGFWGRIIARLMTIAHRSIYKNVATALNLQTADDFLEVGCGSGIFMKSYASDVHTIAGLDHSEDMVKNPPFSGLSSLPNLFRGSLNFQIYLGFICLFLIF